MRPVRKTQYLAFLFLKYLAKRGRIFFCLGSKTIFAWNNYRCSGDLLPPPPLLALEDKKKEEEGERGEESVKD